jgi:predicted glycoside hydrolase/deacetylase ChbG (UPF0249 family)
MSAAPDSPTGTSIALRWLKPFGLAAWAIVAPLYAYKVYLKKDYTDFGVYYRSAARLRDGNWAEVYSLHDGASPFRYIPLTLPLFRPFASFSYDTAKLIWFCLQYAWFALGFILLYRMLRLTRTRHPSSVAVAASLFVLRFCLDCFTIGQVSSLLFFFFAASFAAWCLRRPGYASTALAVPSLVKIGPGILMPLFLKGRPTERIRAVLTPLVFLGASLAGLWIWIALQAGTVFRAPTGAIWDHLWRTWMETVARDSQYFDAAHYGSQSIKSFLLRLVQAHALSAPGAGLIYLAASLTICAGTLTFWLFRKPRGIKGRAYFFAAGIFPYLWVMPETFKYTLTVLALPVALLLTEIVDAPPKNSRFTRFALVFGTLTLSLAGKDLVGDALFFGSQKASIPLLATIFLGVATFKHACRNSQPSRFYKTMRLLLGDQRPEPWPPPPLGGEPAPPPTALTMIVAIPFFPHRALDVDLIKQNLVELDELLMTEMRIEPYGDCVSREHPTWTALEGLARTRGWAFAASGEAQATSSLALRQSFLHSSGEKILVLSADQPADPRFFTEALRIMKDSEKQPGEKPVSLVRGNRRMAESRFRIPVRLLRLVYRRHRLGLYFNRLVRFVLPITTSDTHSRMLVMSRELAREAFTLQGSKDFLFDLELALVAQAHGLRTVDLPLTLYLATEKTPSRMAWESLSILVGLPALAWRFKRGFYARSDSRLKAYFTADDWGISPEVNRGVLDLARVGVIRRVSMMARARYLDADLAELKKIPGIELGLHFDLTFEKARPRDILLEWCRPGKDRAVARRQAVRREFDEQIATLRRHDVLPTYLDGHHHIHLVPGILEAIAPSLHAMQIRTVRIPYDPGQWPSRLAVLNILALLARRSLKKHGLSTLPCFYPKKAHFLDQGRFRASLRRHPGTEVIVHPARANDFARLGIQDAYTDARVREYRALLMLVTQADQTL